MKTISVSKFKATCLKEIDTLSHTGEPIMITKYGKAVAMVAAPPQEEPIKRHFFGYMKGQMQILGDIVSSIGEEDWEALK